MLFVLYYFLILEGVFYMILEKYDIIYIIGVIGEKYE